MENVKRDCSLTPTQFNTMRADLRGAQPMYDETEGCYVLRDHGSIIARGTSIKECYYAYQKFY